MRLNVLGLTLSTLAFSISYALIEYYVIRDTTFGYNPVLFSLIYPYHFAMAAVFGVTAYGLLAAHVNMKGVLPSLILTGALFGPMLVVEDFMWFTLRATAPMQGDTNAGMLIMPGEWTTQFMGSTDAYFTAVPNWYFMNIVFSAIALAVIHARQQPLATAVVSAP
jgi:hypothetical protein